MEKLELISFADLTQSPMNIAIIGKRGYVASNILKNNHSKQDLRFVNFTREATSTYDGILDLSSPTKIFKNIQELEKHENIIDRYIVEIQKNINYAKKNGLPYFRLASIYECQPHLTMSRYIEFSGKISQICAINFREKELKGSTFYSANVYGGASSHSIIDLLIRNSGSVDLQKPSTLIDFLYIGELINFLSDNLYSSIRSESFGDSHATTGSLYSPLEIKKYILGESKILQSYPSEGLLHFNCNHKKTLLIDYLPKFINAVP